MPLYKLFLVREGEPVGHVTRHLPGDQDAINVARSFCPDYVAEVYEDLRLVGRVTDGDPRPISSRRNSVAASQARGGGGEDGFGPAAALAITDFLNKGGKITKLPATISVTGPELVEYLQRSGIEARLHRIGSTTTYMCRGKPFTLRKLIAFANEQRLAQQLPPFVPRV